MPERLFAADGEYLRDPASVIGFFAEQDSLGERLSQRATRGWWEVVASLGLTLLVTREYEHLLLAIACGGGTPTITFIRLPHPSGMAVDEPRGEVHVALTRNPNQIVSFTPAEFVVGDEKRRLLWPKRVEFFPGSNYFHDLAMVGGDLYATAVGHNAAVRVARDGGLMTAWWPRCIEEGGTPDHSRNRIQLNSIAAGESMAHSYFTASTAHPSRYDPGHLKFDPDGRGVLFDGSTRDVRIGGLTRPHSARLRSGDVWLANSGYGELVRVSKAGEMDVVIRLPGWTRGLCIVGNVAIVGTSRVLPRFQHYAPGVHDAVCGVHAVDLLSGALLGSLTWAAGNQIFAVEALPHSMAAGFPYNARAKAESARRVASDAFYRGPIEK